MHGLRRPDDALFSGVNQMEVSLMAETRDRRAGKAGPKTAAAPAARSAAAVKDEAPAAEAPKAAPTPTATAPAAAERETVRSREVEEMKAYGAGALLAFFALGEAMDEDKRLQRVVHGAKLFLIAVIFIAPVLLMWQHAF